MTSLTKGEDDRVVGAVDRQSRNNQSKIPELDKTNVNSHGMKGGQMIEA